MKIYIVLEKLLKRYRNSEEENIDFENAKTILKNDVKAILVDVRSPQEYKEGHIEGSINLPLYDLERNCKALEDRKEDTIILCCQTGNRSRRALEILKKQGCTNLFQLDGGLDNI